MQWFERKPGRERAVVCPGSALPTPAEWRLVRRWPMIVAALVNLLFAGLGLLVLGEALAARDLRGVAIGCLLAGFFGAVVWGSSYHRLRTPGLLDGVELGEREDVPVTRIRQSTSLFAAGNAALGIFTVGVLWIGYAMWREGVWVLAVLAGPAGGWTALLLVEVVLGRARAGGLSLSAKGVHQRARAYESFLTWSDLSGLSASDHADRYRIFVDRHVLLVGYGNVPWQRRQIATMFGFDRLPMRPEIDVHCELFDIDSVLLYHLLRFYLEHPEARDELGTPASLTRIRDRAFPLR
jgi:hypothetical protein